MALSKDITSHVIEFIARTVHFLVQQERTFSMHELVRSLNVNEKVKKMERFPIYTIESAPEQSKPALQSLKAAFGMASD
jgi:hypothetical protein